MARTHTRAQNEQNHRILRRSDVCHICGHPGSDAVDHVIPIAQGGADDLSNKAPAHHDVPCPTCGHKCNREKGNKIVPDIVRRSATLRHS